MFGPVHPNISPVWRKNSAIFLYYSFFSYSSISFIENKRGCPPVKKGLCVQQAVGILSYTFQIEIKQAGTSAFPVLRYPSLSSGFSRLQTLQWLPWPSLMLERKSLTSPSPSWLWVSAFCTANLTAPIRACSPSLIPCLRTSGCTCCWPARALVVCSLLLPGKRMNLWLWYCDEVWWDGKIQAHNVPLDIEITYCLQNYSQPAFIQGLSLIIWKCKTQKGYEMVPEMRI